MFDNEDYDEQELLSYKTPEFFVIDFSNYTRNELPEGEPITVIDEGQPMWTPQNGAEFERLVETRVTHRLADELAVQRIREMKLGVLPHPFLTPFLDMLDKDYPDQLLTVNHLWPRGGNVLLAAQAKAGKSTLVANLLRALCDGDALFDDLDFEVNPVPKGRTVALLDLEMNERRIRDELGIQQIQHPEKMLIAALRGQSESFDITNDEQRMLWVNYLKEQKVHTLIIDPIAPLLAQLGVDENDNFGVTKLFNLLDTLKDQAGITDMMVVHHCGHTSTWRPRGASRFNDWPDAIWMIRLADDADPMDPNAERKFFAKGRDVGLAAPGSLSLDANKRLSFTAGTQGGNQRQNMELSFIYQAVDQHPGYTLNQLVPLAKAIGVDKEKSTIKKLLDELIAQGQVCQDEIPTGGRPAIGYWTYAAFSKRS